MTVDFFVHPDFPLLSQHDLSEAYEYGDAVFSYLAKSKLPVLNTGAYNSEWSSLFPDNLKLKSIDLRFNYNGMMVKRLRGEIDYSSQDILRRAVCGQSDFRIHGVYFGSCTQAFAVQLFSYLTFGELLSESDYQNDDLIKSKERVISGYEKSGLFLDSKIKFGVTMSPLDRSVEVVRPSKDLPFGNITYQLMDEKTVVFGNDRVVYR